MVNTETKLAIGAGLGILAAVLVVWQRGLGKTANDLGGAAVTAADGLIGGAVVGVAGLVGIPGTEQTQCQQDIAAGRTWDASFSCPAKDFLKYLVS